MLKLSRGDRIEPYRLPVNAYRLEVVAMSGDADHYETNKHEYKLDQVRTMSKEILLLHSVYEKLDHNSACDDYKVIEVLEERGKELGFEYPTDIYLEMVGTDITREGDYASLESMQLTFFDLWSHEYQINFYYEDGKMTPQLRRFGFGPNPKLVEESYAKRAN